MLLSSPCDVREHAADRGLWLCLIPGLLLMLVIGLLSEGVHHDDDLTHFLMARWSSWFPEYLLHPWGRPGLTVPLAAVAWVGEVSTGWHAARILSAVVSAAGAFIAARLAARLGVRPAWFVVAACFLQPMNTLLGCTTLTENFAALYLVTAVALLHRGRAILGSFAFALVLITRHEAIALWPLWIVALVGLRAPRVHRFAAVMASISAPLIYNLLFRILLEEWPISLLFQPHGSTEFSPAGVLSYVPPALLAVPPVLAALAVIGCVDLLGRRQWLMPALVATFFGVHVAARALGLFASGGYARFMVALAPLIAILAAAGAVEMIETIRQRRNTAWLWLIHASVWILGLVALEHEVAAARTVLPASLSIQTIRIIVAMIVLMLIMGWAITAARANLTDAMRRGLAAAVAVVLLCVTVVQAGFLVKPLKPNEEAKRIEQVGDWIAGQRLDGQPIFAANPWVAHFLGLVENPRAHKGPRLLASMPAGTIVVWDSKYSPNDYHRILREHLENNPGYEPLKRFDPVGDRQMEVRVYRKLCEAVLAPESQTETSYPIDLMSRRRQAAGVYYIRPSAEQHR